MDDFTNKHRKNFFLSRLGTPLKAIITLSKKKTMNKKSVATFRKLVRFFAMAAVALAIAGVLLVFLATPKPKVLDIILTAAIALAVVAYETVLAIKTNRSPKTLAGLSITYHIISIGLAFVAWFFVWLLAVLTGVLSAGSLLPSGSSLLSSQVSSSGSAGTSIAPGMAGAIATFFALYTISAILFLLLGSAKIVFSFLYLQNHEKWKKAFIVFGISATVLLFLAILFLSLAMAFLSSVQSGFLPPVFVPSLLGGSLLLLFIAQDLAFFSSPEMNFSFEDGMTQKEQ